MFLNVRQPLYCVLYIFKTVKDSSEYIFVNEWSSMKMECTADSDWLLQHSAFKTFYTDGALTNAPKKGVLDANTIVLTESLI